MMAKLAYNADDQLTCGNCGAVFETKKDWRFREESGPALIEAACLKYFDDKARRDKGRRMIALDVSGRDPATQQIYRWFSYDHLPLRLQWTSRSCAFLAERMIEQLPDGPELTAGLRKLLEVKDCFVRAALTEEAAP